MTTLTFEQEVAQCKANMAKYGHLIVNRHHGNIGHAIYCGRGSKWGNQYTHLNDTTAKFKAASREEAVVLHRRQFIADVASGKINMDELIALAGKKLSCYCAPQLCHCSTIAAAADYYSQQQKEEQPLIIYAGIGSRETPAMVNRKRTDKLELMYKIGRAHAEAGMMLRSGGAIGADKAFEDGCDSVHGLKQIFTVANSRFSADIMAEAREIAANAHPAWHRCNEYARSLHTRNVFQILGPNLDLPSDFVVCWTKDGGPTGGTGQAIRIARNEGVPIYNLYSDEDLKSLRALYEQITARQ